MASNDLDLFSVYDLRTAPVAAVGLGSYVSLPGGETARIVAVAPTEGWWVVKLADGSTRAQSAATCTPS